MSRSTAHRRKILRLRTVFFNHFYGAFTDLFGAYQYTLADMIDPTANNLLLSNLAQRTNTAPGNSSLSADSFSSSFSQILSSSMLSGGLLGGSSSGESSSGGLSGMMMPLMMLLLEQMLSQETAQQNEQTSEASAETNSWLDGRGVGASGFNPFGASSLYSASMNTTALPEGRPVGGGLTQKYHNRHFGLDFGVPVGTDVKSTMPGKVVYAGWNNEGYGNLVIVENGPYQTYYAHLSNIPVKVGDAVSSGQVIGLSGNTGNSTGPHLHYEIRRDGTPIDPTSRTLSSSKSW